MENNDCLLLGFSRITYMHVHCVAATHQRAKGQVVLGIDF